mmetsp:Transcript_13839/g.30505  ORF Transcript_13839/g.30505 Transcript_13839/m.30505 type:complete len:446 (-) Transcript_13839:157-1494(-)|eukprot:CAMPEP_0206588548 /NCGR_PEP_ID=MMETSP0325_2-20121206/38355_1 /ASSEMBLY_ACC=CAM_ASM_000347 /TAXON_ID=2866 /ORGANISM="Crypthecodinium cohnii, Strain Seligo" /LENGTH=445 /DNA_ID=CAMNT_0054096861 /DNA_START=31 /DNA_END=1368 /DNA_ORIENTATION=-
MSRLVSWAIVTVSLVRTAGSLQAPADAVDLCGLHKELCDLRSFSGLVPIPDVGSLFYWYFEAPAASSSSSAKEDEEERPFILWLQGGPGASSMLGALFEMGPVTLDRASTLRRRSDYDTWASQYSMLFIDSPVGTGWSFADDGGYAKSQEDVARALAAFLESFAKLHPEAPKSIVLAGESYGGHYIPALTKYLLESSCPFKIRAMLVGDGLTDPGVQVLTKPQEAFALGLLDEKQLAVASEFAKNASELVAKKEWVQAATKRYLMEDYVKNASGINLYDVRTTESYAWQDARMDSFFNTNTAKDLLHIPHDRIFGTSPMVAENLKADVMQSQSHSVESVLAHNLPALLYQGQFDWKDGVTSNEAWIRAMNWTGRDGYLAAKRKIWRRKSDGQIAGYWRHYQNLHQVVVLGAGHMVPMNQPKSAFDMLNRFLAEDTIQSATLPVIV